MELQCYSYLLGVDLPETNQIPLVRFHCKFLRDMNFVISPRLTMRALKCASVLELFQARSSSFCYHQVTFVRQGYAAEFPVLRGIVWVIYLTSFTSKLFHVQIYQHHKQVHYFRKL